jgi:hypothetical protein
MTPMPAANSYSPINNNDYFITGILLPPPKSTSPSFIDKTMAHLSLGGTH